MQRNWKDIKWIFEPDGSLIDLYVQEVSLDDWRSVINLINRKYKVKYDNASQIDADYAINCLNDRTNEIESRSASIYLGEIQLNCHFFLPDQIEFDINPLEVNSIHDFELIENFMFDISSEIRNQITLTAENDPKFPLIKIDSNKKINRILSEKEVKEYRKNQSYIGGKMKSLITKVEMNIAPNGFKDKLLESANKLYKSTRKVKTCGNMP